MRYRYNQQVSPPAPFIHVSLGLAENGVTLENLPAQLDTAADLTAVPANVLQDLGAVALDSMKVAGFDGILRTAPTYVVRLAIRGCEPVTVEVIKTPDESFILLGRDVLNQYRIILDGPQQTLEIE